MSEKSVRKYRPLETFWPYVEPPEELSVEEQEILTPDLQEVLFGPQKRPFSITVIFHKFESEDYEEAVALAKKSDDYWDCLLYTSPSPRDGLLSRMPSSA